MKEELISFETAKLLKEKGFDLETLHFYTKPNSKMFGIDEHGRTYSIKNIPKKLYTSGEECALRSENIYPAPTQSLLQKWLRKVKEIHLSVWFNSLSKKYRLEAPNQEINTTLQGNFIREFDSYEEALEAGLIEALKLIKNK